MAGTPTQYYGFPTYADSDAVDLTAQYNTAVTNIDSELHQLDVQVSTNNRAAIIIGDSWSDDSNPHGFYHWQDTFKQYAHIDTLHVLAQSGATIDTMSTQVASAVDAAYSDVCMIVMFGGVNTYRNVEVNKSKVATITSYYLQLREAYPSATIKFYINPCKITEAAEPFYFNMRWVFFHNNDSVPVSPISTRVVEVMYSIGDSAFWDTDDIHPSESALPIIGSTIALDMLGISTTTFRMARASNGITYLVSPTGIDIIMSGTVNVTLNHSQTLLADELKYLAALMILMQMTGGVVYPATASNSTGNIAAGTFNTTELSLTVSSTSTTFIGFPKTSEF